MKKLNLLPATLALIALPTAAMASEPEHYSFEHDGSRYVYTVTNHDDVQIIHGIEQNSGKRFTLRVTEKRVKGVMGTGSVNFRRSDIATLSPELDIAQR